MNSFSVRGLVCGLLVILLAHAAFAQSAFVYTNNNGGRIPAGVENTVSALSIGADGRLTEVRGSPFATGGLGAAGAVGTSNIVTVGNLLYASNNGDSSISGFSIDPATGGITAVAGSPFYVGGISWNGISLAATPDNRFLIAANTHQSTLFVYAIGSDGALASITDKPLSIGGGMAGIKVTPDGNYLVLSQYSGVTMYRIKGDGTLKQVEGSPFASQGPGSIVQVAIDSTSSLLFAVKLTYGIPPGSSAVEVFRIGADGVLSHAGAAPSVPGFGTAAAALAISPDDRHVFVSDSRASRSVAVFDAASDGSLTITPGSPFATGLSLPSDAMPLGMATNRAGTLLYTVILPNLLDVFSIAGNGALTLAPGSPFTFSNLALSANAEWAVPISFPRIIGATVSGKNLVIVGENFEPGAIVSLNGEDQRTINDSDTPDTRLVARKTGRRIKNGDKLLVRNPDGTFSAQFVYLQ